jgi:cytoskeletal protein CcmA (bactofilin family)
MREERGHIPGNVIVSEAYELWGKIGGDCRVVEGGKMYVRGTIYGDLIVEYGGRVHVLGTLMGNLTVFRGAKVVISGTVQGNAVNDGGRLFINATATVLGKVKTNKGETHEEPKIRLPDNPFET